jgi:hypothetical protein
MSDASGEDAEQQQQTGERRQPQDQQSAAMAVRGCRPHQPGNACGRSGGTNDDENPSSRPAAVFPHRRAITVVLVLLGQFENQPAQAAEEDGGERDRNPSALEQKRRAGETGDQPSNDEAKERRDVHKEPDWRNVVPSQEGRAASRTPWRFPRPGPHSFIRILRLVRILLGTSLVLLLVTATGGAARATARHVPVPTSISFWNARDGVAALVDWSTCSGRTFCKGAIAVTYDGGLSWTTRWRGAAVRSITAVRGTRDAWAAIEPRTACGTSLPSPCPTRLLQSHDGGRTWQPRGQHLVEPSFGARDVGFAVRSRPGDVEIGPVMRTTDGGRSWQRVGGPCIGATGASLSFVSARHGWLLCTSQPGAGMQPKAVFETRNGGTGWRLVADASFTRIGRNRGGLSTGGYPYGLSFEPGGHGLLWQARGDTYSSRDGGRHWRPMRVTSPEVIEGEAASVVSPAVRFLFVRNDRTGMYELLRLRRSGRAHVVHRWKWR